MVNELDRQYKELLEHIIHFGVEKKDRTDTGTKSIFGWQIRHNMQKGFPLLTTKKMAWKQIISELLWFLRGDTNITFLHQNNNHIWDGDAYKNYCKWWKEVEADAKQHELYKDSVLPTKEEFIHNIKTDSVFAEKWGELGPIYGKQWRDWGGRDEVKVDDERDENGFLKFKKEHIEGIDQIKNLINELKTNPDSRRLMVSAWNVGDLDKMVLPPCHYGFQVYTRELSWEERRNLLSKNQYDGKVADKNGIMQGSFGDITPFTTKVIHYWLNQFNIPTRAISLMWNQRSVDTFLGLPFNIASYALLLEIIAKEVNMVPDELIGNLGDTHLYSNHIQQAKEQISREPYQLPTLRIEEHVKRGEGDCLPIYKIEDFTIENYQSHPTIKAPLSN